MKKEEKPFAQALENCLQQDLFDLLDQLPTEEELAKVQTFSPQFETKMGRLCARRRPLPGLSPRLCRVAACLAVMLGVFSTALMVFPQARTALHNLVVEWFDQYTSFSYSVPNDEVDEAAQPVHWQLGAVPQGFTLLQADRGFGSGSVLYGDEEGWELDFSYHPMRGATSIAVDNEHSTYYEVEFQGSPAHLMERNTIADYSFFLWNTQEASFLLSGRLSGAQLMELAQTVEPMVPKHRPLALPAGYWAAQEEESRTLQQLTYRNNGGETILFERYSDPARLPPEEGDARRVKVGDSKGSMCNGVITWQAQGWGFRLTAPQLSPKELQEVAASVTDRLPAYTADHVPQGLALNMEETFPNGGQQVYWDEGPDHKVSIKLLYSVTGREISPEFYESSGEYETLSTAVGPVLAQRDTYNTTLLWHDQNTYFRLESPLPVEDLLPMVESVHIVP